MTWLDQKAKLNLWGIYDQTVYFVYEINITPDYIFRMNENKKVLPTRAYRL